MKRFDIEKVPCYQIDTEDIAEPMSRVALVSDPAIQIFGFAFNLDKQKFEFKADEVQGILVAPTMIPDLKILRQDKDTKEYFTVKFSKETIKDIVEKFHKNSNGQKIAFTHKGDIITASITQSWIKDFDEDKSNVYGFNLPVGTHFVEIKFDDKEWFIKNVLNGEFKGLSIEIDAGLQQVFSIENFEFNEGELITLYDELLFDKVGFDINTIKTENGKKLLITELEDDNIIYIFGNNEEELNKISELIPTANTLLYKTDIELIDLIEKNNLNIFYSDRKDLENKIQVIEYINKDVLEFEVVRGDANSSNIKNWVYNSKKKTLLITFNDKKKYRYYGISGAEFKNVTSGNAACLTSGTNKFGRWWIGKYPSQGAALYRYVIQNEKRYERVYN